MTRFVGHTVVYYSQVRVMLSVFLLVASTNCPSLCWITVLLSV